MRLRLLAVHSIYRCGKNIVGTVCGFCCRCGAKPKGLALEREIRSGSYGDDNHEQSQRDADARGIEQEREQARQATEKSFFGPENQQRGGRRLGLRHQRANAGADSRP